MWYWHKDRHINIRDKIKNSEIILTRVPRSFNKDKTFFSTNGASKPGKPHGNEWSWTYTSHYMWKLAQNMSNI